MGLIKQKKIGEGWFNNLMGGVLKNKNQVNDIINEFKISISDYKINYNKYQNNNGDQHCS